MTTHCPFSRSGRSVRWLIVDGNLTGHHLKWMTVIFDELKVVRSDESDYWRSLPTWI